MEGFVKIHRAIRNHWLWREKPFSKGQAWADLLMLASWEDREIILKNKVIKLQRGQLAWSEVALAKSWGWSRGKINRFLKLLEMEQQIIQQKSNVTTLITIINYDDYQVSEQKTKQKTLTRRTAHGQQTDTNKKLKAVKEVKQVKEEKNLLEGFDFFWKHFPRKSNKPEAQKAWKQVSPSNGTVEKIINHVQEQKMSEQWSQDNGRFVPYPASYLRGRRWEDEGSMESLSLKERTLAEARKRRGV